MYKPSTRFNDFQRDLLPASYLCELFHRSVHSLAHNTALHTSTGVLHISTEYSNTQKNTLAHILRTYCIHKQSNSNYVCIDCLKHLLGILR